MDFVAEHPDGATLAEVSALFGVSRERVRQIEESALAKLVRIRCISPARRKARARAYGALLEELELERGPDGFPRDAGGRR